MELRTVPGVSAWTNPQYLLKGSTMSKEASVEEVPYVTTGTVVTVQGEDYYVVDQPRAGSYKLIRLSDMKDGFKATARHNLKPGRKATDEERNKVYAFLEAKITSAVAYRPGALVKPNKPSKHIKAGQLYVITKVSAKTVSIVELGGAPHGQYVNAPIALLDIVKPEDVLK